MHVVDDTAFLTLEGLLLGRGGGEGRGDCNNGADRTELDNLVKALMDNMAMSEDVLKMLEKFQ